MTSSYPECKRDTFWNRTRSWNQGSVPLMRTSPMWSRRRKRMKGRNPRPHPQEDVPLLVLIVENEGERGIETEETIESIVIPIKSDIYYINFFPSFRRSRSRSHSPRRHRSRSHSPRQSRHGRRHSRSHSPSSKHHPHEKDRSSRGSEKSSRDKKSSKSSHKKEKKEKASTEDEDLEIKQANELRAKLGIQPLRK